MRGYSLLELTAALSLVAIAWTALLPPASRYRDRAAVLVAREGLVAMLLEARTAAIEHGGASLHVDAETTRTWVTVGDSTTHEMRLDEDGRVRLALGGGRGRTEIPYNALGIGVFANETLEIRAGSQRAGLIVSAYGRVRRD